MADRGSRFGARTRTKPVIATSPDGDEMTFSSLYEAARVISEKYDIYMAVPAMRDSIKRGVKYKEWLFERLLVSCIYVFRNLTDRFFCRCYLVQLFL